MAGCPKWNILWYIIKLQLQGLETMYVRSLIWNTISNNLNCIIIEVGTKILLITLRAQPLWGMRKNLGGVPLGLELDI